MNSKKSPWSDRDLHRPDQSADPSVFEPKDRQMKPTHEQTNSPGKSRNQIPIEPYKDRSKD